MKKMITTVIVLAIIQTSMAQHINNVFAFKHENMNSLMLNLELDPALFWGASYNRSFDIRIGSFERRMVGQIGWKTFQFNYNDLNLNFQTRILNAQRKFNMLANLGVENKYLENDVHRANVYNWTASFMPGYYSDKWYIGTELMHKRLFRARFEHTDFYKEIFPEVQDGWYRYRNAYWNVSVNAGVTLSKQMDLEFRIGFRLTHDFQNYKPYLIPYFSDLAINYRF